MPDSSIVALAGVGLLMWFFTSGSTQVRSMDTLVARLLKIADPYLNKEILANYDEGLVRESWITHHMKMPCEGWNEMLKIKQTFIKINIRELKHHVSNDLVRMVQDVKSMEISYATSQVEAARGQYTDGPWRFEGPNSLGPIKEFIEINYQLFEQWTRFLIQILQKVPGEDEDSIDDLMEPFNAAMLK